MAAARRHPARTSRRSFITAGVTLGVGAVLASCGGGDGDDASASGSTDGADTRPDTPAGAVPPTAASRGPASGSSPAVTSTPSSAFPLTMQHRLGTTTIGSRPERVVTAGFNDADFALAVGVVPVGVANFIGTFDEEQRSWAQDALGGAAPDVVTNDAGELLLERIAALQPDVIVYYNYLDDVDYERLTRIAPTVVEPEIGTRWQQHTIDVGRALGHDARALVEGVEARFAAARDAHPDFAGTTAAILFGVPVGSNYFLLEPTDARVGLFVSLGFEMPATTGEISPEHAALLDQDVIVVVGAEREELEADPVFAALDAVRAGRVAYLGGFEGEFAGALGFDSPLSLPVALDIAVPELARALGAS